MKILNVLVIATMAVLVAGSTFAGTPGGSDNVTQLPEPGTLALLAGGVATALLIRRKKR